MISIPRMINIKGQALTPGITRSSKENTPMSTIAKPTNGINQGLGIPKHISSLSRRLSGGGGVELEYEVRFVDISAATTSSPSLLLRQVMRILPE
jgi:hypothetical protein